MSLHKFLPIIAAMGSASGDDVLSVVPVVSVVPVGDCVCVCLCVCVGGGGSGGLHNRHTLYIYIYIVYTCTH